MTSEDAILTILVTTYNRAVALNVLLEMLVSYQKRGLAFRVLVSDDCSNDNTEEICRTWENRMQRFSYIKTHQNLGMDNNFRNAYEHVETPYCFLLGDTRHISYEGLKNVIEQLQQSEYDAFILRCREEMPKVRKVYTDITTLMKEQGWHITNNASCVIPKRFINPSIYQRYMGTTFLHMGIMVDNLCQMPSFKVLFMGDVDITELEILGFNKIGWAMHPFLNFGKLWYEFVMLLPDKINNALKQRVLIDHNRYTRLFALKEIPLKMALYGEEYVKSYRDNRSYMKYVTETPLIAYDFLISLVPMKCYQTLYAIYKKLFRRNRLSA